MPLRDYVGGDRELRQLTERANLLIIPILNADNHERAGLHTRINQRGPDNAGWRANSSNPNRDCAKLDTPELRAVMDVINDYRPNLYLDIHVTNGEDYQYDITYGYNSSFATDSPAITRDTIAAGPSRCGRRTLFNNRLNDYADRSQWPGKEKG